MLGADARYDRGEHAWRELGGRLAQQRAELAGQGSRHMWEVGDWLMAGEDQVFRHMKRVKVRELGASITGYSAHTLKMAVCVARRVDPAVRVHGLSWWHHLHVAWLTPAEQTAWLTRAAEEGWSAEHLRTRLRDASLIVRPRSANHVRRLLSELVKLRRDDIPEGMVGELARWWRAIEQRRPAS